MFQHVRTLILVTALTSVILAQSEQAAPPAAGPATGLPAARDDRQASLAAARQLYTSADYQGALDMLDRLVSTNPPPQERQSIDLYRILCFVALGRTTEADSAIAAMTTRDPLYRPADSEIPPRLRPMFADKRKLVLPSLIQSKYEQAKEGFDRSDYKSAADGFTEVLIVLSDPDIAGQASKPPLSDLRVLAIGFKDLAVRAMTPTPAPELPTPQAVPRPEFTATPPEAPLPEAPGAPAIYDSNDADVVAPVTVNQDMPPFQRPITADRIAAILVVIDEAGRVESAIITRPVDSYYDSRLLQAAKTWRYQPATRNGVAVKYRKSIQLTLLRQTK